MCTQTCIPAKIIPQSALLNHITSGHTATALRGDVPTEGIWLWHTPRQRYATALDKA